MPFLYKDIGRFRQILAVLARLAFALVLASIVIGSSIIMQTHMEPMLFGYPAIGVIGYLVTGFLGLWLVWAILRSGRL